MQNYPLNDGVGLLVPSEDVPPNSVQAINDFTRALRVLEIYAWYRENPGERKEVSLAMAPPSYPYAV